MALSGKTRGFWKSGGDRQVFTIERTTAEDLAVQFPEQADLILKKNNVLQENQASVLKTLSALLL
ncbi:hypothetical protein ACFL1G_07080 [Planctomycetota bacterium]